MVFRKLPAFLTIASALSLPLAPAARAIDVEEYEKLIPNFMVYIDGTQVKSIRDGTGGPGGHAVVYIHGLCKDYSVHYPRVKICDPNEKQLFPHKGVGISVDSQFKNTNLVVVPGYDLLVNGELPEGAMLDKSEMDRTLQAVIDRRVFEGVELHEKAIQGSTLEGADYVRKVADLCVGTDFGLTYGRDIQEIVTPLTGNREILQKMVDLVNGRVERYFIKGETFHWSALYNNCAHLSSALFDVAGIRSPIRQELPFYEQVFNMANPGNGIFTLNEKTNFRDLDPWTVWKRDAQLRDHVMKYGELPIGAGSLVDVQFATPKNQFFYAYDLKRFVFPPKPLHCSRSIRKHLLATEKEARYFDMKENALDWQERVGKALSGIDFARCGGNPACEGFMRKYEQVLGAEFPKVETLLSRIQASAK